jgi:hypothetical protein
MRSNDLRWLREHGFKRVHEKSGGALTRYRKTLAARTGAAGDVQKMTGEVYWEHEGRKFSAKVEIGPVTLMVFSTQQMRESSAPVPQSLMLALKWKLAETVILAGDGLSEMEGDF